MTPTDFGLHCIAPLPGLDALANDHLIIRADHPDPLMLVRRLPGEYGTVLRALDQGHVVPLNPKRSPESLATVLARLHLDHLLGRPPRRRPA